MEYFVIIISSIFVNNIVLSQFLGICPFLGVSNKVSTSLGMGAAVTFVLAIASIVAYLIQYYILVPLNITYMQTIVFILVIAALVQMVEIILKKVSPALYQALGIFLPLITTNCAVLFFLYKKNTTSVKPSYMPFRLPSGSRWLWCCSQAYESAWNWKMSRKP